MSGIIGNMGISGLDTLCDPVEDRVAIYLTYKPESIADMAWLMPLIAYNLSQTATVYFYSFDETTEDLRRRYLQSFPDIPMDKVLEWESGSTYIDIEEHVGETCYFRINNGYDIENGNNLHVFGKEHFNYLHDGEWLSGDKMRKRIDYEHNRRKKESELTKEIRPANYVVVIANGERLLDVVAKGYQDEITQKQRHMMDVDDVRNNGVRTITKFIGDTHYCTIRCPALVVSMPRYRKKNTLGEWGLGIYEPVLMQKGQYRRIIEIASHRDKDKNGNPVGNKRPLCNRMLRKKAILDWNDVVNQLHIRNNEPETDEMERIAEQLWG